MRGGRAAPLFAVFRTEVLLNTKRVAPYAMLTLFAGNALLWWGWGPAGHHGGATNSEYLIVSSLTVYSFMTLPLFTAVIMGDPVVRDFRTGIAPLIFSKPLGRAEYLLGKFFGNLFVLVCCQAAFSLTFLLLQFFHKHGMIVQTPRFVPYFKHFFVLVVVSHAALAAFYFAVGTLTRNVKIVYALAASFYPLYIAYQVVLLKGLPAPNYVLLLSKLMTTLLLSAAAAALAFAAAALLQLYKGHAPVEPLTYLKTLLIILLPGAALMTAAAAALNVTLRDKYLGYAACLALGGGLFYLYNLGFNHPLYNPLLYGLWAPADLQAGAARLPPLLTHRLYCLALAALCLSLSHLFFARASERGLRAGRRLTARGRAALTAAASAAAAVVTGLLVAASQR